MRYARRSMIILAAVLANGAADAAATRPAPFTANAVNAASFAPLPEPPTKRPSSSVMKTEILLSRAHFSPGAIDGVDGDNFRKALGAYQKANGLTPGPLDQPTWDKLSANQPAPLVGYALTRLDIRGPFTRRIPTQFEQMSRLNRLGYRDIKEMLAERFHTSIAALLALNPKAGFRKADETIQVPNAVTDHGADKAARVTVDKGSRDVEAFAADNRLIAFYPASVGSTEKPAPTGNFEIRRVVHNPDYTYDPAYKFKGVKAKQPFRIAPGPNNPVGAVWMDLSFEGYGIHGTPDPEAIGKTQSHGCVRLTNWDALDLAGLVDKGTPVAFQDGP